MTFQVHIPAIFTKRLHVRQVSDVLGDEVKFLKHCFFLLCKHCNTKYIIASYFKWQFKGLLIIASKHWVKTFLKGTILRLHCFAYWVKLRCKLLRLGFSKYWSFYSLVALTPSFCLHPQLCGRKTSSSTEVIPITQILAKNNVVLCI